MFLLKIGDELTSVNGSVSRLCTDSSNFDMVNASDQLC